MTQTPSVEPARRVATPLATPQLKTTLEGEVPPLTDDAQRRKAIDLAFDYRGDVTLDTADGQSLTGYVFNRHADAVPPTLDMMLAQGGQVTLTYDQITQLTFSGDDKAAGRTWEAWLKRYVDKKIAGESANIDSEYQ